MEQATICNLSVLVFPSFFVSQKRAFLQIKGSVPFLFFGANFSLDAIYGW